MTNAYPCTTWIDGRQSVVCYTAWAAVQKYAHAGCTSPAAREERATISRQSRRRTSVRALHQDTVPGRYYCGSTKRPRSISVIDLLRPTELHSKQAVRTQPPHQASLQREWDVALRVGMQTRDRRSVSVVCRVWLAAIAVVSCCRVLDAVYCKQLTYSCHHPHVSVSADTVRTKR